jgi:hypothetical protein
VRRSAVAGVSGLISHPAPPAADLLSADTELSAEALSRAPARKAARKAGNRTTRNCLSVVNSRIPAAEVASILEARGLQTRATTGGYVATCPLCERNRCLSITDGATSTLVHCASCQAGHEAIAAELGVDPRQLGPYKRRPAAPRHPLADASPGELLAAHRRGELELPVAPAAVELPKRAGRLIRLLAEDIALIADLPPKVGGRPAFLYAPGWAAGRLGEDKRNVRRAIRWLRDHGVIEYAGRLPKEWGSFDLEHPERSVMPLPGGPLYRLAAPASGLRAEPDAPALARPVKAGMGTGVRLAVEPLDQAGDLPGVGEAELDERLEVAGPAVREGVIDDRGLSARVRRAEPLAVLHVEALPQSIDVVHAADPKAQPGGHP